MDHTSEDYSYYEYVEANEENNLEIIKEFILENPDVFSMEQWGALFDE